MTSSEEISIGVEELLAQAKRLGLVPSYRIGTVLATSSRANVMVTLDNDTVPSRCYNFAGPLFTGQRVLTMSVKPHGVYVISRGSAGSPVPLVQTFIQVTGGVWTPPAGLTYATVEVQAAGGGGAGAAITAAAQWSFGDGGGGGEYARGNFSAAELGTADIAVVVGSGGAGGVGAAGGSTGGTSSFAAPGGTMTAIGGGGGSSRTASGTLNFSADTQTRVGGTGGTGGTMRIAGNPGGMGIAITTPPTGVRAGDGGSSFLGGATLESLNANGKTGASYGGGGSGAANSASQVAARNGGTGAQGIVVVTSYFN
jgi:hypothetical protein